VANKGRCKTALSRSAGLEIGLERPLVCVPLAGTDAAGQSLLCRALPRLLDQDLALLICGKPEAELERALVGLTQDHPGTVGQVPQADDEALRRCLSAADFVLTARSDAPAGHLEMAAQRYGSLPIAAASGGTPDVVVDADPELETGTGFLYEEDSVESLLGAVGRALSAYGDERFAGLRRRVMRRDLGWDRPARRYVQIYRRARGESVFS
jgi:starch synthase